MTNSALSELSNATKIIELFGGIRPTAKKLGVPVTTVQGWKKRDVIPANRVELVLDGARRNNVSLDGLEKKGSSEPVTSMSGTSKSSNSRPFGSDTSGVAAGEETVSESSFASSATEAGKTVGGQTGSSHLSTSTSSRNSVSANTKSKDVQRSSSVPADGNTTNSNLRGSTSSSEPHKAEGRDGGQTSGKKMSIKSSKGSSSNGKKAGNEKGSKKSGWLSFPSVLAAALTALLVSLLFWLLAGSSQVGNSVAGVNGANGTTAVSTQSSTENSTLTTRVDADLSALTGRVDSVEGKVSTVESKVSDLAAKTKALGAGAIAATAGVAAATAGGNTDAANNDSLEAFRAEIGKKVAGMETQIADLSSENKALSGQIEVVTAENADLKALVSNSMAMPTASSETASAGGSTTETVAANASASDLSNTTNGVSAQLGGLRTVYDTKLQGIEERLSGFETNLDALQTKVTSVDAGVGEQLSGLIETTAQLKADTASQLEAAKSENMAQIAAVTASVGSLTSKSDELAAAQASLVAEQKQATEQAKKTAAETQMAGNRMLGASRLRDALQSGGGYADELAFLSRNVGEDATLSAITAGIAPYAENGPSPIDKLSSEFTELSSGFVAEANEQARADGVTTDQKVDKIKGLFAGLIKRVDTDGTAEAAGDTSLSAQLGSVRGLIKEDNIGSALEKLDQIDLPESEGLAAWVAKARERELVSKAKSTLDSWLGQFSAQ